MIMSAVSDFFENRSKERKRHEKAQIAAQQEQARQEKKRIAEEKKEEQKKDFIENMEDHYQKAVTLYGDKKYSEAAKEVEYFIKYNKLDYREIEPIYKEIAIWELEEKVRKIPASEVRENLSIYQDLFELDPLNEKYREKLTFYQTKLDAKLREEQQQRLKAGSDLELLSWHWSSEHGYATAEGEVKNISGKKLERIEALVTWYDKDGTMITSDSSLIEYDPLLPGQTSPFKVYERYNPEMNSARIEFKFMWGGKIPTYRRKSK